MHIFSSISTFISSLYREFFHAYTFFHFAEFFHTEKSHVRTLKVLDRLFFRPLIENSFMSRELVDQLFPNLEDVLAQHNQYNQKMKERAKAGFPVLDIGDMLCEMVRETEFPCVSCLYFDNHACCKKSVNR